MTQSDILDVLIGAIILLVALIGLWQGIVRTLLFLCGSFLGSELALWWADDIGDRLADWLPMTTGTGRFVASTALIIVAMVVVGACFGTLLQRYPNDWRNRAGGLVTGLALGAITIGLILRYFVLFQQSRADAAIGDTNLAWRLWDDFNVIIAVAAVTLVVMVIVGWVIGPVDREVAVASSEARRPALQTGQSRRDQTNPPFTEPPAQADRTGPSFAGPTVDSYKLDESLFAAPATNGPPPAEPSVAPAAAGTVGSGARGERSEPHRDDADSSPKRASVVETATFAPEDSADLRETSGMCPNCGTLLKPGDAFCPNCGFPVES